MNDALLRLQSVLTGHGRLAIAVSGGVDSMTLAHVAHTCIDAVMVHAVSPAVPAEATGRVRDHAARAGWRLTLADAGEFADPRYLTNPVNRCYFCKSNLYDRIGGLTDRRIASGANLDDLGDYRPGLMAAQERRVVHPLIEAGIDKATLRAIAARLGLADLSDLPAQPCLASRVETGIAITPADMGFVEGVEAALRRIAPHLATLRCRILHAGVVIEVDDVTDPALPRLRDHAAGACATTGRVFAGIRPYRRGAAFVQPGGISAP
ncbi:MAG: adenine nucleotide alpha hydrolase [Paracoccaceae bacterium]|nr:MAG: adenine nucleotide alpha hydrolase [Paracoccaceae bacterium]